jgi:hypothetical protein
MATKAMPATRLRYRSGELGAAVEAIAAELQLVEGEELELRREDGRIVVEVVRPKILAPVSDVAAREERRQQVAAALDHAMTKHHALLALLAK